MSDPTIDNKTWIKPPDWKAKHWQRTGKAYLTDPLYHEFRPISFLVGAFTEEGDETNVTISMDETAGVRIRHSGGGDSRRWLLEVIQANDLGLDIQAGDCVGVQGYFPSEGDRPYYNMLIRGGELGMVLEKTGVEHLVGQVAELTIITNSSEFVVWEDL